MITTLHQTVILPDCPGKTQGAFQNQSALRMILQPTFPVTPDFVHLIIADVVMLVVIQCRNQHEQLTERRLQRLHPLKPDIPDRAEALQIKGIAGMPALQHYLIAQSSEQPLQCHIRQIGCDRPKGQLKSQLPPGPWPVSFLRFAVQRRAECRTDVGAEQAAHHKFTVIDILRNIIVRRRSAFYQLNRVWRNKNDRFRFVLRRGSEDDAHPGILFHPVVQIIGIFGQQVGQHARTRANRSND
ncbi:hypothetical protein D3C73_938170 [compost metagenome]